jgi:hypothetical protein
MIKVHGDCIVVNPILFVLLVVMSLFSVVAMVVLSSIDSPTEALEISVQQNKFCEKHGMVLRHRLYEKPRCVKKGESE